jgi:hypothetical protein
MATPKADAMRASNRAEWKLLIAMFRKDYLKLFDWESFFAGVGR